MSTGTQTRTDTKPDTDQPRAWNVVLLDDDDHTYEYVIRMVQELFAYGPEKAFRAAQSVDEHGRVVLLTTHKEHAELKRDQVLAYGKDALLARSQGSMSAVIEPAEFEGDDSPAD
ncbi:MAG: ATP-dependent Clp protease ClpS [Phycisphaerae bacterium]|nr:MAG: ATP-dependent Clp protease ClpS [Phycisphaerae bacterium]